MFKDVCTILFFLGLGIIAFGIDQIFTVRFGDKWYPGLSASFWKISDETSRKLVWSGLVISIAALVLMAIYK